MSSRIYEDILTKWQSFDWEEAKKAGSLRSVHQVNEKRQRGERKGEEE